MDSEFDLSEADQVFWETDNDGLAAYVVTISRDGRYMRTDAPTELDGEWLGKSERRRWVINESKRQANLIREAKRNEQ